MHSWVLVRISEFGGTMLELGRGGHVFGAPVSVVSLLFVSKNKVRKSKISPCKYLTRVFKIK